MTARVLVHAAWSDVWRHERTGGADLGMERIGEEYSRSVYRLFDTKGQAVAFQLASTIDVGLVPVDDGWFMPFFAYTTKAAREERRLRESGVSLDDEYISKLLIALQPDRWYSEQQILEVGERALTPFEWTRLRTLPHFKTAPRKTGEAYRLTKDGIRARALAAVRQQLRERQRKLEERLQLERKEADRISANIAALRAALPAHLRVLASGSARDIIYLTDRSGENV